jgi:hypothetical protein
MTLRIDLAQTETAPFEPTAGQQCLAAFVGSWRGSSKLWLDPNAPPDETTLELHAELVLGGRWLRIAYRGMAFGKPHGSEMLVGYHKDAGQYELAWIDSSHTGSAIMFSTGKPKERGVVDVLGSYAEGEQRWGWRTRLHMLPSGELALDAFNISPDGVEERAIATLLSRT